MAAGAHGSGGGAPFLVNNLCGNYGSRTCEPGRGRRPRDDNGPCRGRLRAPQAINEETEGPERHGDGHLPTPSRTAPEVGWYHFRPASPVPCVLTGAMRTWLHPVVSLGTRSYNQGRPRVSASRSRLRRWPRPRRWQDSSMRRMLGLGTEGVIRRLLVLGRQLRSRELEGPQSGG